MARLDHRRQVAVRRGDEPHVHPQRTRAAQALEFVLLQHAQDLCLRARAHVADFVEEQRAAVGLLEAADALLVGAGERALLVAEQLGLEEVLLERRAVHLDEVARVPQRVVVDGAGDQLLAGTRFAANQHGRVALRDLFHDVEDALQRRARADDAVEFVDVLLGAAEVIELVLQAPHLERLVDLDLHLLDFERLLDVIERPALHGFDGGGDGAKGGHQDDSRGRVQRTSRAEHVEAVAAAHFQIAQHDIEIAVVQPLDRRISVRRFFDIVAGIGEATHEAPSKRVVIVSDENSAHLRFVSLIRTVYLNHAEGLATGNVTLKHVP